MITLTNSFGNVCSEGSLRVINSVRLFQFFMFNEFDMFLYALNQKAMTVQMFTNAIGT